MAKGKERQALAIRDAVQRANEVKVPYVLDRANAALQAEATRVFEESGTRNGGSYIVIKDGDGYVRNGKTLVQFAGGAVAVTTHD